ncbi:disulfide bond formation protein B, partial [Acinetobacter baumannii]
FIGHLVPCEMCHWQRWPHYTAIALAALAFVVPQRGAQQLLVALAALAIITSGAIGVFHAGVEYHWWQGITPCATTL